MIARARIVFVCPAFVFSMQDMWMQVRCTGAKTLKLAGATCWSLPSIGDAQHMCHSQADVVFLLLPTFSEHVFLTEPQMKCVR